MIGRFLGCLVLAACTSSGTTPDVSVTPVTERVVTSSGVGINITREAETVGFPVALAASPDTVFAVVLGVYADLNVPVTRLDQARRLLGNGLFRTRRRLGGVAMQTYVDCGGTPGEPNAETFDMELSVLSYVSAGARGGATLVTTLSAAGHDPRFGKDRQMRCSSTGELEKRIAAMVRARLGLK